jgi:5-methylcytosine-specific restriction endonuclease McrA
MTGYREKCLRHKGRECVECGATENIEVHHVDTNRWNNSLDNLAPVCHDCHNRIHSSDPEMRHWREKFNSEMPRGEVTESEMGDALR